MPYFASAGITLRSTSPSMKSKYRVKTYTPSFDINQVKHNTRIENTTIHKTNIHTSYLTDEINHNKQIGRRVTLNGKNSSFYHQYTPQKSIGTNVTYTNHITMKTYNPANNTPFDGGDAVVTTGFTQYAYGPPAEGPISDVILPLLLFTAVYLSIKRKNIAQ